MIKGVLFLLTPDKGRELETIKLHLYKAVLEESQTEPKCPVFKISLIFGSTVSFKGTR